MINVSKAFFPPLEDYEKQLKRIWKNNWLTNRGELVKELELNLKNYLNSPDVLLMTNGTLPIQIALKILAKQGEVITTPFSYVATSSAIIWENCTPVFVDIDPKHLTIDEEKISAAITSKTTAILATHVFGNPCAVEVIERIAKEHGLYTIYDAAHCFDVSYKNKSIFSYGDVSTCSFHATKLFHTGEGGGLFCNDKALMKKVFYSHSFGHDGPTNYFGLGINAKMSELHAAMGLTVLPYIKENITARKKVVEYYNESLDFSKLEKLTIRVGTEWNYSYYPIMLKDVTTLLRVTKLLNENQIYPRRYFYPSLNTIPYINGADMPISEDISARILCLPLYRSIRFSSLKNICDLINLGLSS